MFQQYWLPGTKGYLVHTRYIPSVLDWILAYMAKFGDPWFPETKASLWQIMILWQSGPCIQSTSNIDSLGERLFGTLMLHTLCCGINIDVSGQVWGALVPRNECVPLADYDFMAVWTLHPMYQQYRLPGSKGYLIHTCYIPSLVEWILAYMAKFGVPCFPETKASLWQIVIIRQSGPCTLCTSNIGSLGQRAIWYTHVTYPLLWNEYWRR